MGPVGLVLVGIFSVQAGAAIAGTQFGVTDPIVLVGLRLMFSALVLGVVVRPRLRGHSRRDWQLLWWYAGSLLVMNVAIYESFSRIPLGVAVTIEFLGPIAVALVSAIRAGRQGWWGLLWVALAAAGVLGLGLSPTLDLDWWGVTLAVIAAAGWASYIWAGSRIAATELGPSTTLAIASLMCAAATVVPMVVVGGPALLDPRLLAVGLGIAVLSSVIPYSAELRALRWLPAGTFGILMSVEPAVATLMGLLILDQQLSWLGWGSIACVMLASIGVTWQQAYADRTSAREVAG